MPHFSAGWIVFIFFKICFRFWSRSGNCYFLPGYRLRRLLLWSQKTRNNSIYERHCWICEFKSRAMFFGVNNPSNNNPPSPKLGGVFFRIKHQIKQPVIQIGKENVHISIQDFTRDNLIWYHCIYQVRPIMEKALGIRLNVRVIRFLYVSFSY